MCNNLCIFNETCAKERLEDGSGGSAVMRALRGHFLSRLPCSLQTVSAPNETVTQSTSRTDFKLLFRTGDKN